MVDATLRDRLNQLREMQVEEYKTAILNCAHSVDDNSGIDAVDALDRLAAVQKRIDALDVAIEKDPFSHFAKAVS